MPFHCLSNQNRLYSSLRSSRQSLISQSYFVPMLDKEIYIFKLSNSSQHRFYSKATELLQLKHTDRTSTQCQVGLALVKRNNYAKYWVGE